MRSPQELRQYLGQAVIHVRQGRATSRLLLARAMGVSPTTAGDYADQLIGEGFFVQSGLEKGSLGRPKRLLKTVPGAGWFAGIEFNAERVQAVRIDFSGTRVASAMEVLSREPTKDEVLKLIHDLIVRMKRGALGPLLGIGVGAPGVVDPTQGLGVQYAFMPDWNNVPVAEALNKAFGIPVTVENNLRAIALAERWFGGAQTLNDFLVLGPRSGFGIAIVIGGKLMSGVHHSAGEIGQWPWPERDSATKVHDRLSAPGVLRRLGRSSSRKEHPQDLRQALAKHAEDTSTAWSEVVDDYAALLGNFQLLLDLPVSFLHGPLTALGTRFCDEITRRIAQRQPLLRDHPLSVIPSSLGDDAGALGAGSLAMERWQPRG